MSLTKTQRARLLTQLDRWAEELVNLTKRNKLLHFKHTKSGSLEFVDRTANQIDAKLNTSGWSFFLPPETSESDPILSARPSASELVTNKTTAQEVITSLRQLERKSSQTLLDTGIWILYVAYGMLRWVDPNDNKHYESPLLLVPVRLTRDGGNDSFTLKRNEDDAIINPALSIKLEKDFRIGLPTIEDEQFDGTPQSLIEIVAQLVARKRDWSVDDRTVLTTFTFHKEAMFRDLVDHRDVIADHPLVHLVALGSEAGAEDFHFETSSDDRLDVDAPSEDLVSIRDADSTQRKCIVAARNGKSFIINGPPGTGKSQTIANIIAELMHAGKTVLFVSEKAAALEVVANRLKDANLDEFVLELHSHKATRKEVAIELGRSLDTLPVSQSKFREIDRTHLRNLRQELNDYAIAQNEVRYPIEQSLHEVLGQVSLLHDHPHAPNAPIDSADISGHYLKEVSEAALRLSKNWSPVDRSDDFLWRELRDTRYSASRKQSATSDLRDVEDALDELTFLVASAEDTFGFSWSHDFVGAAAIETLIGHIESLPRENRGPIEWLTRESLDLVHSLLELRGSEIAELNELGSSVRAATNANWRDLPLAIGDEFSRVLSEVKKVGGALLSSQVADGRLPEIQQTLSCLRQARACLVELRTMADKVAAGFQVRGYVFDLEACRSLVGLTELMGSSTPPEEKWLDPIQRQSLIEARDQVVGLLSQYREMEQDLGSVFSKSLLGADLVGLHARMSNAGRFQRLGSSYRADKKAVRGHLKGGKVTATVIGQLVKAIEWQKVDRALTTAENSYSSILGSYFSGRETTDIDRLERAVDVALRALDLSQLVPCAGLKQQLSLGGQPDSELLLVGRAIQLLLDHWGSELLPILEQTGLAASGTGFSDIDRNLAAIDPLISKVEYVLEELGRVTSNVLTTSEAAAAMHGAMRANEIFESQSRHISEDRSILGDWWVGPSSDLGLIERALTWADEVRRTVGGPVPEPVAASFDRAPVASRMLGDTRNRVVSRWEAIVDQFETPWRDELNRDFNLSLRAGVSLVQHLLSTVEDIGVWERYCAARQELVQLGLEDVVRFMVTGKIQAEQVVGTVTRAVLETFADKTLESDPRLQKLGASQRDQLVEDFRRLDRLQVANASARVINACALRRPHTNIGPSAIIRREAQKRSRHMAIRKLLSETSDVALAVKPCFMMSPLSVSQFLPAAQIFDVVIFDEASQVKPSDAINCIYRGRQMIVAGDPRQLPPTSFFDLSGDDSDLVDDEDVTADFESILDAFLGSGLPLLPLRWHYRSQHEALITYSNYKFYDGSLLTFPGAKQDGTDVGVELIPANGVYRRGGARDNPIEAAKVVERVIFHRRNNPDLTIGVIAFSSAQENAIIAELERQRLNFPEIGGLLGDSDRLDGFFVKNLENVQGDERDIIIFSIGYGPDENGHFTEQLGPLGRKGGERRLNVAITRARRRLEVVASIDSRDFPGTSSALGIRHLQRYLDFASRGMDALAEDISASQGDVESVFEEAVLSSLRRMGYEVVPQVGVAGFRIDLGVRHPSKPGEFVLGVECDGAAYHSSLVARDRDRLRQEILEGLGWRIHRIWGPAWFRDQRSQESALKQAIEDAISGAEPSRLVSAARVSAPVVMFEEAEFDHIPEWAHDYVVARWVPSGRFATTDVHLYPQTELSRAVEQIVRVEGPISQEVVIRRLTRSFGRQRAGSRMDAAFRQAIGACIRGKMVTRVDQEFLGIPGADVQVRIPVDGRDDTLRTVLEISPTERGMMILGLVNDAKSADINELLTEFRTMFGWGRAGADIESCFMQDVARLVRNRSLSRSGNRLSLGAEV